MQLPRLVEKMGLVWDQAAGWPQELGVRPRYPTTLQGCSRTNQSLRIFLSLSPQCGQLWLLCFLPGFLSESVGTTYRSRKLFKILGMINIQAVQSQVMSLMVTCPSYSPHLQKVLIHTYLGDIAGLVPDHRNKSGVTRKRHNLYAGRGCCLKFVKNITPVKCSNMRNACNGRGRFQKTTLTWGQMFTPEELCIKSLAPSWPAGPSGWHKLVLQRFQDTRSRVCSSSHIYCLCQLPASSVIRDNNGTSL